MKGVAYDIAEIARARLGILNAKGTLWGVNGDNKAKRSPMHFNNKTWNIYG